MATFDGTEVTLDDPDSSLEVGIINEPGTEVTLDDPEFNLALVSVEDGCLVEVTGGGGVNNAPPTITITPAEGTILQPGDAVVADILGGDINYILAKVKFKTEAFERVIYDGVPPTDNFRLPFGGGTSTIVPITGGFRLTILHQGGWPTESIDLTVAASNGGGTQL